MTDAYLPGQHLALDRARQFTHPTDRAFVVTTRRVVVVDDDGRVLTVQPVAEKTGEAIDGAPGEYVLDRYCGPIPVKQRWTDNLATAHCPSCEGSGRREPWVAAPMTAREMAAFSKLLEPWCPKACQGRGLEYGGGDDVHIVYTMAGGPDRFDLKVCEGCGRLRRNAGAVRLREAYRAPLAVVGETETDEELENA